MKKKRAAGVPPWGASVDKGAGTNSKIRVGIFFCLNYSNLCLILGIFFQRPTPKRQRAAAGGGRLLAPLPYKQRLKHFSLLR
jgi:hypothetical protein